MRFAGPRWKCERCARGQNPGTATTAEPPIKLCQRHTRHREGRLQSPLPLTFLMVSEKSRIGPGGGSSALQQRPDLHIRQDVPYREAAAAISCQNCRILPSDTLRRLILSTRRPKEPCLPGFASFRGASRHGPPGAPAGFDTTAEFTSQKSAPEFVFAPECTVPRGLEGFGPCSSCLRGSSVCSFPIACQSF